MSSPAHRYYLCGFSYSGVKSNHPSTDTSTYLERAYQHLRRYLGIIDLKFIHDYSWTDGSIYLYIKTYLNENQLRSILSSMNIGGPTFDVYFTGECTEVPRWHMPKPWVDSRTVEEYFEDKEAWLNGTYDSCKYKAKLLLRRLYRSIRAWHGRLFRKSSQVKEG